MLIKRDQTNRMQMISKAQQAKTGQRGPNSEVELVGAPEKGTIDQSPGGAANVTFSLDAWYELTGLRVEDVPVDGTAPKVMWRVAGKSAPLNSLLYGRDPVGMKPFLAGTAAEPLVPGAPYRLIVEAGRRRGTINFTTIPLKPPE